MNNMCQFTNFDLVNNHNRITKYINKNDREIIGWNYIPITLNDLGGYPTIFKVGYCTNSNEGKYYPIFFGVDGEEKTIYLGKTGMYEFQPEEWVDENDEDSKTEEAIVYLEDISKDGYTYCMLVPENIPFCFDYCYSV